MAPSVSGIPAAAQPASVPSTASDHGIPTSVAFTSTEPAHIVASSALATLSYMTWRLAVPSSRWNPGEQRPNPDQPGGESPKPAPHHHCPRRQRHPLPGQPDREICALHGCPPGRGHLPCRGPNGVFLMSGSHDCSLRLWSLDNKHACRRSRPTARSMKRLFTLSRATPARPSSPVRAPMPWPRSSYDAHLAPPWPPHRLGSGAGQVGLR